MRKIVYTKVLIDLIAGCIFDGLTDEETGLLAGVSGKQIGRLRAGNDCQQIRSSVVERMRKYIALIRDGEDRSNRWQRIAWFLERRYPDRWAKPEVLLNVNTANAVTNNTLVITAEQALTLKNRNASIDKALQELAPPGSRYRSVSTIPQEAKSLTINDNASQLQNVVPNVEESLVDNSARGKTKKDYVLTTPPAPAPATRTPKACAPPIKPTLPPKYKSVENSRNSRTIPKSGIVESLDFPKRGRKRVPPRVALRSGREGKIDKKGREKSG